MAHHESAATAFSSISGNVSEVAPRPQSGILIDKKVLFGIVALLGAGALLSFMDAFNICPICGGDGTIEEVELAQSGVGNYGGEIHPSGKYASTLKPKACPWLITFPWLHTSTA